MNISSSLKNYIRHSFPWPVYWWLKRRYEEWHVLFSNRDLTTLARIYKTDKVSHHDYTSVYQEWFEPLRFKRIRLLEIGVGGYAKAYLGGESLRMWKRYFPFGRITGIDIHDKTTFAESRISIYQGDQSDKNFLHKIVIEEGPFDIIIEDGSHMQSHIITSFETLFRFMAPGGIYVIEDTQTSYWPEYEGSTTEMHTVASAMNYFIKRIHDINRVEWRDSKQKVGEIGKMIDSIGFYHNLIVVVKKSKD